MGAGTEATSGISYNEELRDMLIAISVTAKRLATKMENDARRESTENSAKKRQGG